MLKNNGGFTFSCTSFSNHVKQVCLSIIPDPRTSEGSLENTLSLSMVISLTCARNIKFMRLELFDGTSEQCFGANSMSLAPKLLDIPAGDFF